jgi:hypothetical protein
MATIEINRAPVLTLWGVVVAERLGHDPGTALTLGKALAGLNAQAKGRMLGIFHARTGPDGEPAPRSGLGEEDWVPLCGRSIPVKNTAEGLRAVKGPDPILPEKVAAYLEKQFGDSLPEVRAAMEELAGSMPPDELDARAYALYERFRPAIPSGHAGWGKKGVLDLAKVRSGR